MKCPIDNTTLQMSERQGIEIDYCPTCRGIWLDRGELDKLIEKSEAPVAPRSQEHSYRDPYQEQRPPHKRKKESMLGELFDF